MLDRPSVRMPLIGLWWVLGVPAGSHAATSGSAASASITTQQAAEQQSTGGRDAISRRPVADEAIRFAVIGHVRGLRDGGLYYQLDELLEEVVDAGAAFTVLTGDIVWGDVQTDPADSARVVGQWEVIDAALRALGTPVYRVPGNHDINDLVTRDIYFDRYGDPQRFFDVGRNRFVFISSAWIPEDGDTRKHIHIRGRDLDSAQIAFLRESLPGDDSYDRAFVFMHHLLWWEDENGPWWRDVHPVLAKGKVAAVFSGDYGPAKYSYLKKDGVEYFQSAVAPDPSLGILRGHEWNRVLAQQFDNWMLVTVDSSSVVYDVETIGEMNPAGHWTPERWRAVYGSDKRPPRPDASDHFRAMVGARRGLYAVVGALVLAFVLGVAGAAVAGRAWRRVHRE